MPTNLPSSPPRTTSTISIQTGEDTVVVTPAKNLLQLPLEVIGLILDHSFELHPAVKARNATSFDSRSHGWSASNASLAQMKVYQAAYADQLLPIMKTCKTFYHHLRPRLYEAPVLLTPKAIEKFYSTIKLSQKDPQNRLYSLVKTLVLYPSQQLPPQPLIESWAFFLGKFFKRLSYLQTFSPGIYTSLVKLENTASSLPLLPRLEKLDNLDLFESYVAFDPKSSQDGALSLINRTSSRLKRISFSTINLLEPGCGVRQASKFLTSGGASWPTSADLEAEAEEFSPEDSCASRFLQAIRAVKVGVEWEETREEGRIEVQREKGIESVYFFGESSIGMAVFYEMLINMPNLRCLHLDAFTMLAPSLSDAIPFYQPRSKRLSLPKLVESFSLTTCHLTELTFAPLFVGSTLVFGAMDEILTYLPHLTHLELRADFVSPSFFKPLLASPHSPLKYLALHVLPPHTPPVFATASHSTQGTAGINANPPNSDQDPAQPQMVAVRKAVAITVCQFIDRDQIDGLAQAVEDLFFSEEYSTLKEDGVEDNGGGEKVCTWPKKSQEEFGDDQDGQEEKFYEPFWYDLIMRLGRMGIESNRNDDQEEDDSNEAAELEEDGESEEESGDESEEESGEPASQEL
ncbi:hypothetical protein JCM3765_006955 [Sporobolomyces pararoseus]